MHELNEDILDKEIRLIGAEGQQLGIMSSQEALKIADEQGLDLVKISPQAVPPVCKLMNYGKFRFEQSKKEKEARQKFIADGNRVKVSVRFRGREMAHTDIGRDLLNQFAEQCAEVASMDKSAKLEGRMMSIFLSPKTSK